MLPTEYTCYLKQRRTKNWFQSKAETVASFILANHCKNHDTKEFVLIGVGDDTFSEYHVTVTYLPSGQKKMPKLCIDSAKQFGHTLKAFWERGENSTARRESCLFCCNPATSVYQIYDPQISGMLHSDFLPGILAQVSEVEPYTGATLYVFDTSSDHYANDNALMYALQSKFAKIVRVGAEVVGSHADYPIIKHVLIPKKARECKLDVTTPMTLHSLIITKGDSQPTIAVPLVPETLAKEAVNGLKWSDIIPQDATPDCTIAGMPVYYVVPDADIDGYQNIFLTFSDIDRKRLCRYMVANALNADFNKPSAQKPQPAAPAPSRPQAPKAPAAKLQPAPAQASSTPAAGKSNAEMYNSHTCKIRKGEYHTVESLFSDYITSRGGTGSIEFRDGYLYKNWLLLQTFMERIFGISQRAHSENPAIKVISKFSIMIKDMSTDDKEKDKFNSFMKKLDDYKRRIKASDGIEFSYGFMTVEDDEGAHARSLILDNGWQIDFDGGLDFLYVNPKAVNSGKCERNTRLHYIDLRSPVSKK